MAYHSQRKRSFAKALTWRIISVLSDLAILYFITRKIALSIGIAIATNITSTALYYSHERAWNRIDWGKHSKPVKNLR